MSELPEISAIVISFHGEKFLAECLATLKADLAEFRHEIIVVDNGSADRSLEIVGQVAPEAKIVAHPTNFGFARGVNSGIEASTGKYIWILNQDIRIRPGCLRVLLNKLKSSDSIGMVGPKFVGFDGALQYSARALPRHRFVIYKALLLDRLFPKSREFGAWKMTWFDHTTEMEVEQPMGAAMLVPRTVIDKIGVLDETFPIFFNDVDFCRRLSNAGYSLWYCPAAVIEHFVGGSTRRAPTKMVIESHKSLYRYLRKYARPQEYPLLWLCGLLLLTGLLPRLVWASFKPTEPTVQAPTSVSR